MISSQQLFAVSQSMEKNKFQIFKIRGKNEKCSNVELHGKNLVKNFFSQKHKHPPRQSAQQLSALFLVSSLRR
jgi:hypothetical protein